MLGDIPYRQPYIYLDQKYLLTVNEFVENAPYGMRIRETGYLFKFGLDISKNFKQFVNFKRADMLLHDPDFGAQVVAMVDQCEAVYVFANISFILESRFYDRFDAPQEHRNQVLGFMRRLMKRPIPMLVSQQAMNLFSAQMEVHVPMLGTIRLSQEEGGDYLRGFLGTDDGTVNVKVDLVDIDLVPFGMLVFKDSVLIYTPSAGNREENYFMLPRMMCVNLLDDLKKLREEQGIPLTEKLMDDYLRALPALQGRRFSRL